jgi:hypothetical protein
MRKFLLVLPIAALVALVTAPVAMAAPQHAAHATHVARAATDDCSGLNEVDIILPYDPSDGLWVNTSTLKVYEESYVNHDLTSYCYNSQDQLVQAGTTNCLAVTDAHVVDEAACSIDNTAEQWFVDIDPACNNVCDGQTIYFYGSYWDESLFMTSEGGGVQVAIDPVMSDGWPTTSQQMFGPPGD